MRKLGLKKKHGRKEYNTTKPRELRVIGRVLFKIWKKSFLAIRSAFSPSVHLAKWVRTIK
jgi:hypothetical protein